MTPRSVKRLLINHSEDPTFILKRCTSTKPPLTPPSPLPFPPFAPSGVPFVRVPTTLLSIVDASVGVKNGIDYCCPSPTSQTPKMYKNRMGSFYAPSAVVIDKGWIGTNDRRNIENGCGEIFKLAIVRSR